DHPICDGLPRLRGGKKWQTGRRILHVTEDTGRRGDEKQVVGRQGPGQLVADDVRVDVVDVAVGVGAEAGDHRDEAAAPKEAQELQVELGDVANVAEIDGVGAAAGDDAGRPLDGADGERARAVQADRPHAGADQRRAEVDVDLAGDGHLH